MPAPRSSPVSNIDRGPISETTERGTPDPAESSSAELMSVAEAEAVRGHSEPAPALVAREAAAIYLDTNDGRPTPEEIAAEAYRMYVARGTVHGGDLDDWLDAERQLSQARRTES
jgi:hypothetical protein